MLKVYRVFFVNESEKFRGETNPLIRGGAIYLQTFHHFFPPLLSSFSLFLLEHFPIPSLSAANSGFHSFFFLFVSFCRHRLSVTHCPRYCDNVLRVTKLYSLRRKEKLGPYKHRNTLVDVLKRVFPRFRSPFYPVFRESLVVSRLISSSAGRHIHFIRCILASAPVGDTNVTTFHPRVYRVVRRNYFAGSKI